MNKIMQEPLNFLGGEFIKTITVCINRIAVYQYSPC